MREAEVMADAGIHGLLITSEIMGQAKVERLLRILERAPETMVVIDHPDNARELNSAAAKAGITLRVLMDIDPGTRRTGIAGGAPAIELAQLIHELSHLEILGIHSYSGSSAHIETWAARREHSLKAMEPAVEIFVPHCDPTVNLYSRIHCMRGGKVEAIWPVLGRHG